MLLSLFGGVHAALGQDLSFDWPHPDGDNIGNIVVLIKEAAATRQVIEIEDALGVKVSAEYLKAGLPYIKILSATPGEYELFFSFLERSIPVKAVGGQTAFVTVSADAENSDARFAVSYDLPGDLQQSAMLLHQAGDDNFLKSSQIELNQEAIYFNTDPPWRNPFDPMPIDPKPEPKPEKPSPNK